jgi:hypothetical protein
LTRAWRELLLSPRRRWTFCRHEFCDLPSKMASPANASHSVRTNALSRCDHLLIICDSLLYHRQMSSRRLNPSRDQRVRSPEDVRVKWPSVSGEIIPVRRFSVPGLPEESEMRASDMHCITRQITSTKRPSEKQQMKKAPGTWRPKLPRGGDPARENSSGNPHDISRDSVWPLAHSGPKTVSVLLYFRQKEGVRGC